jgi:hypothetical protein
MRRWSILSMVAIANQKEEDSLIKKQSKLCSLLCWLSQRSGGVDSREQSSAMSSGGGAAVNGAGNGLGAADPLNLLPQQKQEQQQQPALEQPPLESL